jgi:ADP-ribose pyrophosphatase YjhB (NUDIX family)
VLLSLGERLVEAARRAVVGKLGVPERSVLACGQLATFDEPNRDPRGPTLSLAMWAVVTPDTDAGPGTCWVNLERVPELPFDHNRIVADSRPVLSRLLWRDVAFTRALTGDRFPVGDAVEIQASLDGRAPDRGNLNRLLRGIAQLSRTDERRLVHGTGRPSTVWQWNGEQPDR